jgi:hypothetical protein
MKFERENWKGKEEVERMRGGCESEGEKEKSKEREGKYYL